MHKHDDLELIYPIYPIIEPIKSVFTKLANASNISPFEYNFHRSSAMPSASQIMKKTQKSWTEILSLLNITPPVTRNTKSTLGNALHLLEKKLIVELGLGWQELAFRIRRKDGTYGKMRPDSFCTERMYLQEKRMLIVDVKLSIYSAPITIYKYLPIFQSTTDEKKSLINQKTFFPSWLPEEALNLEPMQQAFIGGQTDLFLQNDILYIAYLIGERKADLLPGTEIRFWDHRKHKKSKKNFVSLPANLEVRFIPFCQLPQLYCSIGGIDLQSVSKKIQPILEAAEIIKKLVLSRTANIDKLAKDIYSFVKSSTSPEGIVNFLTNSMDSIGVR